MLKRLLLPIVVLTFVSGSAQTILYPDGSKQYSAYGLGMVVPFPDSFTYRPPFHILKNQQTGTYFIDEDFSLRDYARIQGTGTTYYVNVNTGDDANSGTSEGSPLKSVSVAIAKTDVSTVMIAPGYYYHQYSWAGVVPTRSIELIASGPGVYLTNDYSNTLTFTSEGGLYKARTTTQSMNAWDRSMTDVYGDPYTLTKYTSKSQVDTATVGAWYWGSDTLYIRLSDFRTPDSNVTAFNNSRNIRMVGEGLKYYFQGFTVYGPGLSTTNTNGSNGGVRVYVDSLTIRGGMSEFDGTSEVLLFNSSFAKTKANDLINYDPQNGVIPVFVEYNITSYNTIDNGSVGSSEQASTAHNKCRGIRVNSVYKYTNGQCVADVGACQSWLINCTADSSVTGTNYLFGTGLYNGGFAWLQDCKSYNHAPAGYDLSITTTHAYLNNFQSDNFDYSSSFGTLDSNYISQVQDVVEFATVDRMMSTKLVDLVPAGITGQTVRYSGSALTANSFLWNTGSQIGIGTTTPAGMLHMYSNSSAVTHVLQGGVGGITTQTAYMGTAGTWNVGQQNNIRGGALIWHTGSIGSTSALMSLSRAGNLALGTTDYDAFKMNVNGTFRIGTVVASTRMGDHILVWDSATGQIDYIPQPLSGSDSLDFGSTLAQTSQDLTITVIGAQVNDPVAVSWPSSPANSTFDAFVSAANTVTVRFNNYSASAIDPAKGFFKVKVLR